jgi:hypothetical protein
MLRIRTTPANDDSDTDQLVQVVRACGHTAHVGTCAQCQRAQLAKWEAQLADVIDR